MARQRLRIALRREPLERRGLGLRLRLGIAQGPAHGALAL